MNIVAERAEIIRRINLVNDVSLIRAFKYLLDNGLDPKDTPQKNRALDEELATSIGQSNRREVRPHEEVWTEIRKRYRA